MAVAGNSNAAHPALIQRSGFPDRPKWIATGVSAGMLVSIITDKTIDPATMRADGIAKERRDINFSSIEHCGRPFLLLVRRNKGLDAQRELLDQRGRDVAALVPVACERVLVLAVPVAQQ